MSPAPAGSTALYHRPPGVAAGSNFENAHLPGRHRLIKALLLKGAERIRKQHPDIRVVAAHQPAQQLPAAAVILRVGRERVSALRVTQRRIAVFGSKTTGVRIRGGGTGIAITIPVRWHEPALNIAGIILQAGWCAASASRAISSSFSSCACEINARASGGRLPAQRRPRRM